MIFFLSTLAIFQCYILPGLLITNKLNGDLLFKIISTVIISLLFNFFLVTFLLALKLYSKEVLYIIFLFQILILFFLYKSENFKINFNLNLFFLIKVFVFSLIIFAFYKNTGNVFYSWDAVVSYNEWAIKFSTGEYPGGMVRPYLIPKIWSMIYLFSDNSNITLFTKFTTILFPSLILLMSLDEILFYKKIRDLIKLFLFCTFFFLKKNFILTGYVDIPLVALIYCFFYFYRRQAINLSAFTLFISFTIKMSAIFLLIYFLIYKNKYLIIKLLISLAFILFFIFLYYSKLNNFFTADIFNEMGQNNNFNLFSQLQHSTNLLFNSNLIFFLIFSIFGFFINNFTRSILIIYIIPGWLYWSLLLSYDDRNFLFLIPGLIIINSIVVEKLILKFFPMTEDYFCNFEKKIFISKIFKINSKTIFLILSLIACSTLAVNDRYIIKYDEVKKNSMIGNNLMNLKLIELVENNRLNRDNFITDFQLIFYVPALKKYINWGNFLHKDLKNLYGFDYYLVYGHSPKIREVVKEKINNKKTEIILDINGFILAGPNYL